MALKQPSEDFECRAFTRWLSRQTKLLFSKIPIGDNTLDSAEGKKLQSLGVRRGVPDFVVAHKDSGRVLWVEMKRTSGGKLSEEQKVWLAVLRILGAAERADGYKEARRLVENYYSHEGTKYSVATARATSKRVDRKRAASTTRVFRAGREVPGNDGRSRKGNAWRTAV